MRNVVRARRPALAVAALLGGLNAAGAAGFGDAVRAKALEAQSAPPPAASGRVSAFDQPVAKPAAPVAAPQGATPSAPAAPPTQAAMPAQPASPAPSAPMSIAPSATGVVVSNLSFQLGPVTYRIPDLELRGTTMSPADVTALLDPNGSEPIAARIQRLQADEIAIPEVQAVATGLAPQQTRYRDITVRGVKDGRIASVESGGGSFEVAADAGGNRGSIAHIALKDIDLGLALALYDGTAGGDAKPVYGGFSFEGIAFANPDGSSVRIARLASGEVRASAVPGGLARLAEGLGATPPDLSTADPAERARFFGLLSDLLRSVDLRSVEMTGIEFASGKSAADTGRFARIAFTGATEGRPSELRLDGLDVDTGSGHMRVGAIAVGGVSLLPYLEAARVLPGSPDDPATIRKLIPAAGSLRISDIGFEQGREHLAEGGPTRFSIGTIEIAGDKPVENVPSDLRIGLRNIAFPVEVTDEQQGLKSLADLGYQKVDASLGTGASWSEAQRQVMLREFSLRASDMGSVTISGIFGNIGREAFDPDPTAATIALASATARSLDITVENNGLFERAIALQAKRQNRQPDEIRREYGIAAAIGVPAMLGNAPAAKTLGSAIAQFVAKPGRLTIQARAKDPAGLGMADLMANQQQPLALLDKLDVTASAQ
jgi:hypothetical protein